MRNTKNQSPNTKQTPTIKTNGVKYAEGASGDAWVLNDGATESARHPFDLEERTAVFFGEGIVRFAKKVPRGPEPSLAAEARTLYREARELLKIFSSMHRK